MSDTTTARTFGIAEAAAQLGVHKETVYKRVRDREWPCTRMGRHIHFTPENITEILALCKQPALTSKPRRRSA